MREFDVILYGATGFTGRQGVKYFSQHAPQGLRWAIAARDRTKLDRLDAGVPAIVADSRDQPSIDQLVRRARIVLSTAGPFELYSDAVVDACVRLGTHYVDISGETLWIRSLIDRHHQRAAANGTRIIPAYGFDSVPSDLGATWVARQIGNATEVKAYYEFKGGPPNGGTVATAFRIASSGSADRFRDPFLLVPEVQRSPHPLEFDPTKAHYDQDARTWVTPFIMGAINTRIVRRSCALLGLDLAYQEFSKSRGAVRAYLAAGLGELLKSSLNSSLVRKQMQRLAPAPGTGPTEETMDCGWFRCEFFARAADGRTTCGLVSAEGDPANRVTVKCACESALALACDGQKLPDRAGVLTPSTGLGQVLLDRLNANGIRFAAINPSEPKQAARWSA
jgi:short subunit dehydrogenase-like uncharacterized protein